MHYLFSCLLWSTLNAEGQTVSTVDEEKKFNPRLTKTLDEFVNIMNNLNLPKPKKIGIVLVYLFCMYSYNTLLVSSYT